MNLIKENLKKDQRNRLFLKKIKQKFFKKKNKKNAYSMVELDNLTLTLTQALFKLVEAQKKTDQLKVFLESEKFKQYFELLRNTGIGINYSISQAENLLSPNIEENKFDLILGENGIDLESFAKSVRQALQAIDLSNFRTCLNIHKLATIAALVYIIPNGSSVVEVGSHKCGTTIFMAQLCRTIGKKIDIYACDTFQGMPAATEPDKSNSVVYDTGMFTDNLVDQVQAKLNSQGLQDSIHLVKGDVTETLLNLKPKNVALVFLDTDQYKGTRAGLDFVKNLESNPHIIVDDSTLVSVGQAMEEFIKENKEFSRKNIFFNFDYLYAQN